MDDGFNAFLGVEFANGLGSGESGTNQLPNIPLGSKVGEVIPGQSTTFWEYWDGNLSNHSWPKHGWGGKTAITGAETYGGNAEDGPRITFGNLGIMACRVSHYYAAYDNSGTFLGFVPLSSGSALAEASYAGQMIATVVQYFHHENFILDDLDVSSLRLSVNPAREPYKYYKNKTLSPSDFFFLENEVAVQGKQRAYKSRWDADDAKSGKLKIGKYTGLPFKNRKSRREKYLVRDFAETTFIGSPKSGTSKINYAITPQWIFPSSNGSLSATTSANTTNDVGKAVWIYRFPRQLDEATQQSEIDRLYVQDGMDYSMSNTKNAYPFPAFKKNVGLLSKISFSKQIDVFDNYSVLGRMEFLGTLPDTNPLTPSKDSSLDASNKLQLVDEGEETIRLTRKEIPIIPMIGTMRLNHVTGIDYYFDTTSSGSNVGIRLMDPETYTYLSRPSVNYVFFPQKSFSNVGDQFLAIGQALLPYDETNIDSRLSQIHNSERMVLALENVTAGLVQRAIKGGQRSTIVDPNRPVGSPGDKKWDFLVPKATVTTSDLVAGITPPGYVALDDFVRIHGDESLSASWVSSLDLRSTIEDSKPSATPGFYDIELQGITYTYPYSIALFEIQQGYIGPILELDEDNNYLTTKEGHMQIFNDPGEEVPTDAFFLYHTQTGKWIKQRARFKKFIAESTGDMEDDLERTGFTESTENVTIGVTGDTATVDLWLGKYGKELFVIPGSWSQYFIPGSDRVTGQQIFDAWIASGESFDLPMMDSSNFAGLGNIPFKKTFGVEVIDVTQKWGELGMNRSRYTGDMNFQAVQAPTDVGAEQLGYVAFEATHSDLGNPLDKVGKKIDSTIDTAKDVAAGGAGILLGVQGGLLLGAGLGAIFVAALAAPHAVREASDVAGRLLDMRDERVESKKQLQLGYDEKHTVSS